MNKNQRTANELDHMEGLTDKARHMIAGTDFNLLSDMFDGHDAESINQMAEEVEIC